MLVYVHFKYIKYKNKNLDWKLNFNPIKKNKTADYKYGGHLSWNPIKSYNFKQFMYEIISSD